MILYKTINLQEEIQSSSINFLFQKRASFNYKLITVDDEPGSNVLFMNGTLIHRNDQMSSVATLQERIDYPRVPVDISELVVNNHHQGIDSLCLMIRKSSRIQTIV